VRLRIKAQSLALVFGAAYPGVEQRMHESAFLIASRSPLFRLEKPVGS
jgi:hypothetical protein